MRGIQLIRTRRQLVAVLTATVLSLVLMACHQAPESSAAEGKVLYGQNGCASCHGPEGHGDGPVSQTLVPRPRDFRDVAAFRQGTDVAAIARTIATGVLEGAPEIADPLHAHHGRRMPRFDHLLEPERRSLALYVISLRNLSRKGNQP